jgi:hypothetical protein
MVDKWNTRLNAEGHHVAIFKAQQWWKTEMHHVGLKTPSERTIDSQRFWAFW